MFSDLRVRFRSLFRRTAVTQEIDQELQFHIEQQMEKYLQAGLTREEARRRVRLEFGGLTQTKEDCQEARGVSLVEHIGQDVRYAMRMFGRTPGFTIVVVMTLALGIGANTAVFSLINAVLLKMLPVKDPEQLVQFSKIQPVDGEIDYFSYPEVERFQHEAQAFSGVFAFANLGGVNVEANGHGEIANGQVVSGNYFSTLGVSAILGRTISPADDQVSGGNTVAVISYKYWRERLAGDPAVVGKKIVVNNYPVHHYRRDATGVFWSAAGPTHRRLCPAEDDRAASSRVCHEGHSLRCADVANSLRVFYHGSTAARRDRRQRSRSPGAVISSRDER